MKNHAKDDMKAELWLLKQKIFLDYAIKNDDQKFFKKFKKKKMPNYVFEFILREGLKKEFNDPNSEVNKDFLTKLNKNIR